MIINNREISRKKRPYLIAEMSGNHGQNFEQAKLIVHHAKKTGADALKLQTYTPDTITLDCDSVDFYIENEDSLWAKQRIYDLYENAHTRWDWVKLIIELCEQIDLTCFSSVFDETSVDFLEDLNVPAYKISSFENNHFPLIKKVASTGKPIIISTGASTIEEVDEAVEIARQSGCNSLGILKCTSDYPANPMDVNLVSIPKLIKRYNCPVGFSDHTLGLGSSIASVAFGACIIEKHFTTSRKFKSVDSEFSANTEEFTQLRKELDNAWKSIGTQENLILNERDIHARQFKRSIYVSSEIKAGESFSSSNLRVVRPGFSIHSRYLSELIGKQADRDYKAGDRLEMKIVLPEN